MGDIKESIIMAKDVLCLRKYHKPSEFTHLGMKMGLTAVIRDHDPMSDNPKLRDNESSRRHLQKKWEKRGRRNMVKRDTRIQIENHF